MLTESVLITVMVHVYIHVLIDAYSECTNNADGTYIYIHVLIDANSDCTKTVMVHIYSCTN